MKSALTALASRSPKDTFSDWPTIDTMVTSAKPIVSATAVADVRRGLRAAFARASRPEMGMIHSSGRASSDTTDLATTGLSTDTATKVIAAPAPSVLSCGVAPSKSANRPRAVRTRPTASSTPPLASRFQPRLALSPPPTLSDRPATGEMREALMAGTNEAMTVKPTPTTTAHITVRSVSGSELSGSAAPSALNRPLSPRAPSMPKPSPATEATMPMIADSVSTDRRTCWGVAPMARISDSSRTRWPSTMLNVLEMMNMLTNSTMKANTSRIVWNGPMMLSVPSLNSSADSVAVMTSTPSGSTASMRLRTSSMSAPASARATIAVNSPG